jgi:hypothetical protein
MLFLLFWPRHLLSISSVLDRGVAEYIYWPAVIQQSGNFDIWLLAINATDKAFFGGIQQLASSLYVCVL